MSILVYEKDFKKKISKVEQSFSFKIVSTSPEVTVGEEIGDIGRAMGDC